MDLNEMLEKLECGVVSQLAALHNLDERIHSRLDQLKPCQSVISKPLIGLEELLDEMSNLLQRDMDLLKRLVKLRDGAEAMRPTVEARTLDVDWPLHFEEYEANVTTGKCYFARRNSVLRIPIPPNRKSEAAVRRLSRCAKLYPPKEISGAVQHECQNSFDSGIHLCQQDDSSST